MKSRPRPNELRDMAAEIKRLREYPAAIRNPEIDKCLAEAERWAESEYAKVTEIQGRQQGKTFKMPRLQS